MTRCCHSIFQKGVDAEIQRGWMKSGQSLTVLPLQNSALILEKIDKEKSMSSLIIIVNLCWLRCNDNSPSLHKENLFTQLWIFGVESSIKAWCITRTLISTWLRIILYSCNYPTWFPICYNQSSVSLNCIRYLRVSNVLDGWFLIWGSCLSSFKVHVYHHVYHHHVHHHLS